MKTNFKFISKLNSYFSKKLSIKLKLTLWSIFFTAILIFIFIFTIFYVSNSIVRNSTYKHLKSTVSKSFDQIKFKDNNLEIDDDIDLLVNDINISIYNSNKEFIYGYSPFYFPLGENLSNTENIKIVKNDDIRWYSYEEKKYIEGYGDVWIRGILESSVAEKTLETITRIVLIGLPFLILFYGLLVYFIIKNYFKPIEKIRNAAEKINAGNDLTKRINLENRKDELYTLANTFDTMFDRLQSSFDSEVQFTSDVSHELRTPISVIMTQSEFGIKYIDNIEEAKNIFNIIFNESKKMSNLVSQLLSLARMDKGHQKLNIESVNLNEIIDIAIESQLSFAMKKNINITFENPFINENDIYIDGDENMLLRVFINLISNGITYGNDNGFIKISIIKNEEHVNISIEDNGIGIEKQHIDKLWTRFYQVDPSRTTDNSGLGLSMVKSIIEVHKGDITVLSEFGKGTTFNIILPIIYK